LSRGWGRPIQAFQVDGRFLTKKLSDMTPEEIEALEERLQTIEAEEPDLLNFAGPSEDTK
jgi:hypothetical protein